MKSPAIILDIDDTLYEQLVPFQKALSSHISFPIQHITGLFLAYRKYSDAVFEASQNGQMSMEEMHIYRLKQALLDYDYMISNQLALTIQQTYAKQQQKLQLDPYITTLLNFCKAQSIPLGIISNGPTHHQWQKVHQLNLLNWIKAEHIVISQEVGFTKPDPRIFQVLEQRMNLTKTQTYYIGDSYQNDVIGAKRAHWKSIWLNTYHKSPTTQYTPDYTVSTRLELYECICQLLQKGDK